MPVEYLLLALGLFVGGCCLALVFMRQRAFDRWLFSYIRAWPKRSRAIQGKPVHLLLCIADHFEPRHGTVDPHAPAQRVRRWLTDYARLFGAFHDSDGRPPRHTFFYPIEQYDPGELDTLGELCRAGFGEVEVHLHHDQDTAASLRNRLRQAKRVLHTRHGLLSVDARTNEVVYGFVHGDWALDNSRPDRTCCGVNGELSVLRETGCYADFTLPSAPDRTQTRKINSLYRATDDPRRPHSHDWGVDVASGANTENGLLLIQGPLVLDWRRRKFGVLPRVENGCLQESQPPDPERIDLWLRAHVQAPGRPDWFFVKLHTHGAVEENQRVLLAEPMLRLHRALAQRAAADPLFHFHYVTAREMCNLVLAAEAGWTGTVEAARDFRYVWSPDDATAARSEERDADADSGAAREMVRPGNGQS